MTEFNVMTEEPPSKEKQIEVQAAKTAFAQSQTPPIVPCTNIGCANTSCTCEAKCGCDLQKNELSEDLVHCDPCAEMKMQKKLAMEQEKLAAMEKND